MIGVMNDDLSKGHACSRSWHTKDNEYNICIRQRDYEILL